MHSPKLVALAERERFLDSAARTGVGGGDMRERGGSLGAPWGCTAGDGGGGAFLWRNSSCARSWNVNWDWLSGVRNRRPFSS